MSKELAINLSLSFLKGGAQLNTNASPSITVAGSNYTKQTVTVGTGDATVGLGSVGTPGYVLVRNLDSVNYISLSTDGSTYPVPLQVKAGELALLRWQSAAIHAKANTASCLVEFTIVEAYVEVEV